MRVIEEGHVFDLDNLDAKVGETRTQSLTFVKRSDPPGKYPFNVGSHPGTTNQEVYRAAIMRHGYLMRQAEATEDIQSVCMNGRCIRNLRELILWHEERAARRHGRQFKLSAEEFNIIEKLPTCSKCGHIFCQGECK
jgi:hypothetical protein